jgi:hypothetical protein
MARLRLVLCAGLLLLPLAEATAQTAPAPQKGCVPTLSNPCRPPPLGSITATPDTKPNFQLLEPTRLEPQKPIPDIQFDRHTSFGIGNGGIIGLQRKFDPKD